MTLSFEFSDIAFSETGDARAEIAKGNYEHAAELAGRADDEELSAVAVLMAGAVGQGLDRLAKISIRYPETHLYKAFGHWCRNETQAALACLEDISQADLCARADGLRTLIQRSSIAITVLADSNNARGAALNPGGVFTVRHLATAAERDSLTESSMPLDGDLLLIYDSATPELAAKANRNGVPCAVLSTDFDQQWSSLYDVFARTDVILGATRLEHHLLSRTFDTRVVSFPFMTVREHRGPIQSPAPAKDFDISFSGIAFAPHWPEKARILNRIAALDDPSLKIRINHGYVDETSYRDSFRLSKFVPLINRMGFSLNQDRTTESLHYGVCGLALGGMPAHWILGEAGLQLPPLSSKATEDQILDIVKNYDERPAKLDRARFEYLVGDFYPPPPERDARMLKFVLFQTLFSRGHSSRPKINNNAARRQRAIESASCFNAFAAEPTSQQLQQRALDAFANESAACPQAIIPPFNRARTLWMMGRRNEAADIFTRILDMPPAAGICIPGDAILPHRIRALSSLLPYHAYYHGMVMDCADGDDSFARVQTVIRATCLTYLSLLRSQQARFSEAAEYAGRALSLCDRHHPAAWQLTKASFAASLPPQRILMAYLAAAELYPPLIDELLPFGVQAMERLNLSDLAEFTVRRWLYTLLRITYSGDTERAVPAQSYASAMAYFARLPAPLQALLKARA